MGVRAPGARRATRLLSRNRFRLPSPLALIAMLPMDPGSLVMERKMLRGIKQRTESAGETAAWHCSRTI
jgi:hypothetical protein